MSLVLYVRDRFGGYVPAEAEVIIRQAKRKLVARLRRGATVTSPRTARDVIHLQLAGYEYEVFAGLFLDNQHRVIQFRELFRGTIDGANVYPREVVKAALECNAAALIFAHNHPSGAVQPSEADRVITQKLQSALSLVDIRVLDHFVIGAEEIYSFAEHGLL